MVNHMSYSRATFFIEEMFTLHNERVMEHDCLNVDYMPAARLAELRVAYGLPTVKPSVNARLELASSLLNGMREWSQSRLTEHRRHIGTAHLTSLSPEERSKHDASVREALSAKISQQDEVEAVGTGEEPPAREPTPLELRSAHEEAVLAAGGWRAVHAREKKPKPGEGKRKHESVVGGKSSKAKVASSSSVPE